MALHFLTCFLWVNIPPLWPLNTKTLLHSLQAANSLTLFSKPVIKHNFAQMTWPCVANLVQTHCSTLKTYISSSKFLLAWSFPSFLLYTKTLTLSGWAREWAVCCVSTLEDSEKRKNSKLSFMLMAWAIHFKSFDFLITMWSFYVSHTEWVAVHKVRLIYRLESHTFAYNQVLQSKKKHLVEIIQLFYWIERNLET